MASSNMFLADVMLSLGRVDIMWDFMDGSMINHKKFNKNFESAKLMREYGIVGGGELKTRIEKELGVVELEGDWEFRDSEFEGYRNMSMSGANYNRCSSI